MSVTSKTWERLRLKLGTSDDPVDWRGTQTSPHSLTATVGGTDTDGAHEIHIVGWVETLDGRRHTIDETISHTSSSQSAAQVAAALEADADANTRLVQAGIVASVLGAVVTLRFPPEAHVTVTASAPNPATITLSESVFPIMASAPFRDADIAGSQVNGVIIQVSAMDDAGATLLQPEDGGADQTFSLAVVEVAIVRHVAADGSVSYGERVCETGTLTGQLLNTPIELPIRGASYWTVRLFSFANNITNVDSYEVAWRHSAT